MCKHLRSTEVSGQLEDGRFVIIHQCDLCGLTLPLRPTTTTEEDLLVIPTVDAIAMAGKIRTIWKELMALQDTITHKPKREVPTGSKWGKFKRKSVPGSK
jgi:hypothetical protein